MIASPHLKRVAYAMGFDFQIETRWTLTQINEPFATYVCEEHSSSDDAKHSMNYCFDIQNHGASKDGLVEWYKNNETGAKWDDCLLAFFSVVTELYLRDPDSVPQHWYYEPGACEPSRDPDAVWHDVLSFARGDALIEFGNILERYSKMLMT